MLNLFLISILNMIESILKKLASETSKDLVSKVGIPSDKLDDVFKVTGDVAKNEIGKQVSKGGLDGIMSLFSNNENNSFANQIQGSLTNSLVSKLSSMLGISETKSKMAAGIIVPFLINLITKENSKTPDNDASPLTSIFGSVLESGGKSGGLGGIVKGLFN